MYIGGTPYGLYGTSASAPAVAGFFCNLNAARLASGKGPVGWINPALYANPNAFVNDITSGDIKCGAQNYYGYNTCCMQGFYAASGWDPATGLGSIDYGKFVGALNVFAPSQAPSQASSTVPSQVPSQAPSHVPTKAPSKAPSHVPSQVPSQASSRAPTMVILPAIKSSSSRNTSGTYVVLESETSNAVTTRTACMTPTYDSS